MHVCNLLDYLSQDNHTAPLTMSCSVRWKHKQELDMACSEVEHQPVPQCLLFLAWLMFSYTVLQTPSLGFMMLCASLDIPEGCSPLSPCTRFLH